MSEALPFAHVAALWIPNSTYFSHEMSETAVDCMHQLAVHDLHCMRSKVSRHIHSNEGLILRRVVPLESLVEVEAGKSLWHASDLLLDLNTTDREKRPVEHHF